MSDSGVIRKEMVCRRSKETAGPSIGDSKPHFFVWRKLLSGLVD